MLNTHPTKINIGITTLAAVAVAVAANNIKHNFQSFHSACFLPHCVSILVELLCCSVVDVFSRVLATVLLFYGISKHKKASNNSIIK